MKKILIIGSIHNHGIDLLKENKNFEFEVVDNTDTEYLKDNHIKNSILKMLKKLNGNLSL